MSVSKPEITDFGAKIGGARKDIRGNYRADDVDRMTHLERLKLVKKDQVWPVPDYADLISRGHDRDGALALKSLRDSIPSTVPVIKEDTEDSFALRCKEYIRVCNDLRELEGAKTLRDHQLCIYRSPVLAGMAGGTSGNSTSTLPWYATGARGPLHSLVDAELPSDARRLLRRNAEWPKGNSQAEKFLKKQWIEASFNEEKKAWFMGANSFYEPRSELLRHCEKFPAFKPLLDKPFESKEAALAALEKAAQTEVDATAKATRAKKKAILDATRGTAADMSEARIGEAYRTAPAVPEDYLNGLKLRGGEFGNWVNQSQRQALLDIGYDSFRDLADLYGWDPEAVSLDGSLAIAFGSRGDGQMDTAHFEAARNVINLTKPNGAGSLAHEFGHALDHYLGGRALALGLATMRLSDGKQYLSELKLEDPKRNESAEIRRLRAFQTSIERLKFRPMEPDERAEHLKQTLSMSTSQLTRIVDTGRNAVAANLNCRVMKAEDRESALKEIDQLKTELLANPTPDAALNIMKCFGRHLGKMECDYVTRGLGMFTESIVRIHETMADPSIKVSEHTDFYKTARELDRKLKKNKERYWATPREMFARAFAAVTAYNAEQQGRTNWFLSDPTHPGLPAERDLKDFSEAITPLLHSFAQDLTRTQAQTVVIQETHDTNQRMSAA